MPVAPEFALVRPNLAIWQAYDKRAKADLFSSALTVPDGVFAIDPIEIADHPLDQLTGTRPIAGIIVTNGNHFRSADTYIRRFSVPLFAHRNSLPKRTAPGFIEISDGSRIGNELEVIAIEGAGPGEVALYHAADHGTLIVGDALINFEPYGFAFLPEKYCENIKQMRESLRKLLRYDAERILFAHGMPILSGANARLRQLFDVNLGSMY
jgi:glyoxylase-like metal-dependent hydrolase (beta-lactamase superfamily II)